MIIIDITLVVHTIHNLHLLISTMLVVTLLIHESLLQVLHDGPVTHKLLEEHVLLLGLQNIRSLLA